MSELNTNTTLKRTLTLPLLIMFGLAYLAPTVVFNYYGMFTEMTGGMYTLSFAITTVVMLFTSYSYVQMVKAYPVAGSAYTYVNKSVQPHLGFLTGWVMLLDYLLLPMICYLLLGIYINEFFPILPVWLIVIVVAFLSAFINIVGMKTASIIDTIIITAQIGFTLLLIIVIAKYVSGGGGAADLTVSSAIYNPATFDLGNILIVFTNVPLLMIGSKYILRATRHFKAADGSPFISTVIGWKSGALWWDSNENLPKENCPPDGQPVTE